MKIDQKFIEKLGINLTDEEIKFIENNINNLDLNFKKYLETIKQNLDTIPTQNFPFNFNFENIMFDENNLKNANNLNFKKDYLKQSEFNVDGDFTLEND